jgi:nicotinate dehydrogenase subunit A
MSTPKSEKPCRKRSSDELPSSSEELLSLHARWGGAAVITLSVNGRTQQVDAAPDTPLLYVLRDHLQLNGAKYGCGLGQCGSCTVMVDGQAVLSCVTPVSVVQGRRIKTVEGLGTVADPGPMQRAFIEEQAAQCGFCIPGMMMRAQALLERNASPSQEEIRSHMNQNLCRCGTHMRILRAIERAAAAFKTGGGR